MSKKQKQMVIRIAVAFLMLMAIMVGEHSGLSERIQPQGLLALICLIPYLIIGYDILFKAARNIRNGQIFDENFLMMIATFGAFGVGEYSEAVAVMLFYQVGELFQSYAVGKSRQSISDMMDICPEYANIEEDGALTQVDPDDVEMLEDLIMAATNEALRQMDEYSQQSMSKITGGIGGMGGLGGLPF